jgi:hypothetical protein
MLGLDEEMVAVPADGREDDLRDVDPESLAIEPVAVAR